MTIKEIRQLTNLSQKKFCEKYGIPLQTLCKWEQGYRNPTSYEIEWLEKIVREDLKMDNNEAVEILNEKYMDIEYYFAEHDCHKEDFDSDFQEAIRTAIQAIKEVQQYREIGTIEECRKAVMQSQIEK